MAIQKVLTANDFDRILSDYAGRQVTHTPTTKTTSNISGQETLTDGSPVVLKAYFMKKQQNYDFGKYGFTEQGDAVCLAKYADSVAKDDKITVDGEVFRVKERFDVPGVFDSTGSGTSYVYTACNLFLIS